MQDKHTIVGVHVTDRVQHAEQVQKVLTECGCLIKTRLGLHDVAADYCSRNGLLLLELVGTPAKIKAMLTQLKKVKGVQVKSMVFGH